MAVFCYNKQVKNYFSITNILIGFLVLSFLAGIWVWMKSPASEIASDKGQFDTQSFSSFEQGEIISIEEERMDEALQASTLYQRLQVRVTSGNSSGQIFETDFSRILDSKNANQFRVGDKVVLGYLPPSESDQLLFGDVAEGEYVVLDRLRTSGLIIVAGIFVLLAVLIGRRQGALSLVGLLVAGGILIFFTAPQLLAGKNALAVSLVSAGLIAILTMFISHGFNKRTKLAVMSTLLALASAIGLSYLFILLAQLFGLGQSDAFVLQAGFLGNIDLRGLLLGGLIISLLGILDDVTTTQTAAIEELSKANPNLTKTELFWAGMSVGKEHIASLINTLILVYVGASLPLFLLIVSATDQPLWVLLNSEYMAEEIVRALSGSTALILAVPIATALAASVYQKQNSTSE
ncbi:TPA: hypothetical protein DCG61_00845 [Patescibacteria group bacterium]|nr:hypothetical protein [Patescibacteria group bacterium]